VASLDETRLLERLVSDADFRARFRRDPAGAAREAGFAALADELARLGNDPLQTLDGRESRSSVAGALMAAAVEGLALFEAGGGILGAQDADAAVLPSGNEPAAALAEHQGPADPVEPVNGDHRYAAVTPEQVVADRERRAVAASWSPQESRAPPSGAPSTASIDHWDAGQFGQAGSGGAPTAEALALLDNPRLHLDASAVADLNAGRIDPRVVSVLGELTRKHDVAVSAMASDHSRLTVSGSTSNHYYGRAVDIASVDGRPVGPGNLAARRLAVALSQLPASIRPSEIGSPWSLPGAAYFTDGAHQNHLHVAYDDPVARGWRPPPGAAAAEPDVARGAAAPPLTANPDDLEGNLDDEDAGADEADGSNEDEADEGGGEDDDTDDEEGSDDDEEGSDDDEEGSDDDEDELGEGSSGEDAPGSGSDGGSEADDSDDEDDADDQEDSDDEEEDSDGKGSDGDSSAAAPSSDADGSPSPDLDDAPTAYPGNDAPREQVAAWMAAVAKTRDLPPELPVMAGLTESGLRNLSYGDADSIGFFQMRLSIWNDGPYSGYQTQPEKQLDWFLDQAEAVKRQRIARGLSVDDPDQYGEWIADIERPAEQYRGRYQGRLADARELLERADKADAKRPQEAELAHLADADAAAPLAAPAARAALVAAEKELGTPYVWGGSSPEMGFDCSGLVQWAYKQVGIDIPRVTDQQFVAPGGVAVERDNLVAGDLVFFRDSTGYIHHVGISLGGDRFLHAPHTGDVVKMSSLDEPYYAREFAGGRRFAALGRAS
jgi:cell wall-associated NlpC family hydrolase